MRGHRIADKLVPRSIDVDDVLRQEPFDGPAAGLFKQRDKVHARDVGFLSDLPHRLLIRHTPCRLIEQLPLIGPDDQRHFATVLPTDIDHRVPVVGEIGQAHARRPVCVGCEVVPRGLFGPARFVFDRLPLDRLPAH